MDIEGTRGRFSTLDNVRSVCERFMLSRDDATRLTNQQHRAIEDQWEGTCDDAVLPKGERERLWSGAILNPFCFQDWN